MPLNKYHRFDCHISESQMRRISDCISTLTLDCSHSLQRRLTSSVRVDMRIGPLARDLYESAPLLDMQVSTPRRESAALVRAVHYLLYRVTSTLHARRGSYISARPELVSRLWLHCESMCTACASIDVIICTEILIIYSNNMYITLRGPFIFCVVIFVMTSSVYCCKLVKFIVAHLVTHVNAGKMSIIICLLFQIQFRVWCTCICNRKINHFKHKP